MSSSIIVPVLIALIVGVLVGVVIGAWLSRKKSRAVAASHEPFPRSEAMPDDDAPARPRAAIIFNPAKSGAAEFQSTARAICRQEGWEEPAFIETTSEDPGRGQAREALEQQADVVIAAGGDGTVRSVAEVLAGSNTPMGIVPMGTGNLLARNLNLPLDTPEWALRIALWGKDSGVDAAHLRTSPDGEDHTFMVMAGIGYDAAVMADTDEGAKDRRGWFAYVETGSRKLTGRRTRVEVSYDGGPEETHRVRSLLAGNCGKVQGGVQLIAGAEIDDGILDVLSVTPKNVAQWVGVVAAVAGGRHTGPLTSVRRCTTMVVRAEEEMDIQLDGDAFGKTTYMEVWIDPLALSVRTPTAEQSRRIRRELRGPLLS